MYIDNHLPWDLKIGQLSKTLSRANGIPSKLRYNATISVCLQVYYAIFYLHISWLSHLGIEHRKILNIIRILQKKMYTHNHILRCHTNQLFIDHKLLKNR